MTPLTLRLLGGFQAGLGPDRPIVVPGRKAQALLAYLAIPPGSTHSREKIAGTLWGDVHERSARASLRQAIFALRKALAATRPPALVVAGGGLLGLNAASVDVDVAAFERLVADGTPAALERASALYRGDLLAGFGLEGLPFDHWLVAERERLRELALDALARMLTHRRRTGALDSAVQTALRLLALDALQEPVHRTLMQLYVDQGRRGAALRQYQHCVGILHRELGVEPEAETRQLYRDILRQRSTRSAGIAAVPTLPGTPSADGGSGDATVDVPLVGRETELAQLRNGVTQAGLGRGGVVAIIGEGGIGKSRLVTALTGHAGAAGMRVLAGASYENEQILAFGVWVDALRTGRVLADDEPAGLKPVCRAELSRLLPEVASADLPPASDDHLRLFHAVAHLLELLAAERPVLITLEDVHWADDMSLRLLSFLARRLAAARILIVATVREEELADAAILRRTLDALERQQHLTSLRLSPLSATETTALVRRLARAGSGDAEVTRLAERVWMATRGNPFMVVETMRALDEGGMTDEPARLPVTERVHRLISGRLERLSGRGRHLAEVAAVIGRDFEFDLLQRATRLEAEDASSGLEELVRRRVLHGVDERFDFTHERIRETAYASLLPPRRRLLHGDVARAIEALHGEFPPQHVTALGRHWQQAEVWSKAYPALRRAGTAAASQSAHREAVACFEHAVQALERLPRSPGWAEEAIDLRFDLQNALLAFGAPERTQACLEEAEALAVEIGDRRRLARASAHMASTFRRLSRHDQAIASARRALDLAQVEEDFATEVVSAAILGHTYETMGEYGLALDVLSRNVAALPGRLAHERFGCPGGPGVSSRCRMALCLAERGEFDSALARVAEALDIAHAVANPLDICDASFAGAFVHLRRAAPDRALAALDHGRLFGERSNLPVELALLRSEMGYAYALTGRPDEAVALLEQASREIEASGLRLRDALRATWLGESYLLADRVDDARRAAEAALALARQRKERGVEGWAHRLVADVAARRGRAGGGHGETHYNQAVAIAESLGMRPLLAHCWLGLGRLHRAAGDDRRARARLTAPLSAFRGMGVAIWVGVVEEELRTAGH